MTDPEKKSGQGVAGQIIDAAAEAGKALEQPPQGTGLHVSSTTENIGRFDFSKMKLSPNLQNIFERAMVLAPDGIIGDDIQAHAIKMMAQKALSGKESISPEDAENLTEIIRQCEAVESTARSRGGERFSSIYLSDSEIREILENPAIFFEKKLRELELAADDPDSILFTAYKRRLDLAAEYFGSSNFDESRLILDPHITQKTQESFREYMTRKAPTKTRLAQYVGSRIDGIYAQAKLSRAPVSDLPKIAEQFRIIGDRSLNMLEAYDGGIVGEWRGRLEQILFTMAKHRRLEPGDFLKAQAMAVEQLLQERAHYEPRIQKFYHQWQGNGQNPNIELTEEYAKGLIARSAIAWRIRMRPALVMAMGEGPAFEGTSYPSFATMSIEEAMLAAYRPREWFMRKWGKKDFLRIWNVGARFTAGLYPELNDHIGSKGLITKITDSLWADAIGPADPIRKRKALERITWLINQNTQDGFSVSVADRQDLITFQRIVHEKLNTLDGKKGKLGLRDIVTIDEGGERMQYMFRPYFYEDSNWRRDLIENHVKLAYTHHELYCLGSKLKKDGNNYFFDPRLQAPGKKESARDTFKKTLDHVLRYRPQALAEILSDGGNEAFLDWFDQNKGEVGYQDQNQMFGDLNRRFIMINNRLIAENLPAIDYRNADLYIRMTTLPKEERLEFARMNIQAFQIDGDASAHSAITPEEIVAQSGHIAQVFSLFGDNQDHSPFNSPEKYFKTMRALHEFLAQNGHARLYELTGIQYDKYFLSLPWEDDIPSQYLEDPLMFAPHINRQYLEKIGVLKPGEEIPEYSLTDPEKNSTEANKFIEKLMSAPGLSEQYTQLGVGSGAPLPRAWGDFGQALDAFNAFLDNNFAPDEKTFWTMIETVYKKIDIYQGALPAKEAVIKLTAAWIGAQQVKLEYGDFCAGMANSSIMKEVRGPNAPSLPLDAVNELRENLSFHIAELEKDAPQSTRALSKFLRVSTIHILGGIDTGISWHELLGWVDKVPVLKKIINVNKLIHSLESAAPLGLTDYKIRMAATLFMVIILLAVVNEAKKGGKEGSSSGGK